MYMSEAADSTIAEDKKKIYYAKADSIYGEMATNMPSVADYATLQRAHIGYALDPETKTGLAKPHYEKLIELINAKPTKDETDNERLIESYRYMGYYFLLQKDKANSVSIGTRFLKSIRRTQWQSRLSDWQSNCKTSFINIPHACGTYLSHAIFFLLNRLHSTIRKRVYNAITELFHT